MKLSDYTSSKKPGRPRSKKSHEAILIATREILFDSGVHALSIEGVAAKARVGKTTIYRHWSSKEELMSEAIGAISDEIEIPDTGNVLSDLTMVLKGMADVADQASGSSVQAMRKVLAGLMGSPALMDVYKAQFVNPRRNVLTQIIKKGVTRGEIRQDIDIDNLINIVGGSYFYTILMNETPPSTEEWLKHITPIMLEGIAPRD